MDLVKPRCALGAPPSAIEPNLVVPVATMRPAGMAYPYPVMSGRSIGQARQLDPAQMMAECLAHIPGGEQAVKLDIVSSSQDPVGVRAYHLQVLEQSAIPHLPSLVRWLAGFQIERALHWEHRCPENKLFLDPEVKVPISVSIPSYWVDDAVGARLEEALTGAFSVIRNDSGNGMTWSYGLRLGRGEGRWAQRIDLDQPEEYYVRGALRYIAALDIASSERHFYLNWTGAGDASARRRFLESVQRDPYLDCASRDLLAVHRGLFLSAGAFLTGQMALLCTAVLSGFVDNDFLSHIAHTIHIPMVLGGLGTATIGTVVAWMGVHAHIQAQQTRSYRERNIMPPSLSSPDRHPFGIGVLIGLCHQGVPFAVVRRTPIQRGRFTQRDDFIAHTRVVPELLS